MLVLIVVIIVIVIMMVIVVIVVMFNVFHHWNGNWFVHWDWNVFHNWIRLWVWYFNLIRHWFLNVDCDL